MSRSAVLRAVVLLVLCGLLGAATTVRAQSAYFSGVTSIINGNTTLLHPYGVAIDAQGDVYVADTYNFRVAEMVLSGGSYSAPVTVPTSTVFTTLVGVAVDASGDVYVSDSGTYGSNDGQVYEILAGSTSTTPAVQVGTGWKAPGGITIDRAGYVFVVDNGSHSVSEIIGGSVTATNTDFTYPIGIAVDGSDNVYVSDQETGGSSGEIAKIAAASLSTGAPVAVVPNGLNMPTGVGVDASGNLWIVENGSGTIDEVLASSGAIEVIGTPPPYFNGQALAIEPNGNVFVADAGYTTYSVGAVDQIVTQGVGFGSSPVGTPVTSTNPLLFTFAASETIQAPVFLTQGAAASDFSDAGGGTCTTTNGAGNPYAANSNCTVNVRFDPTAAGVRYGAVELLNTSGSVIATAYVDGTGTGPQITYNLPPSFAPGTTKAPLAGTFSNPSGLAVDGSGNVYVADQLHGTVQKVSGGSAAPIGSGFTNPVSVALDGAGDVFVADSGLKEVFEIVAGSGTANQLASTYSFSNPMAVAVDANGNVYVADAGSGKVVEIPAASQYTVANVLSIGFTAPDGIAVDGAGNLYVADSSTGTVCELVGGGGAPTACSTGFSSPAQVAIDGNGNLFVADSGNGAVKEILAGTTTPFALDSAATFTGPLGVTVDGSGNVYVANSGANQVLELDYADPPGLTFGPQEDGTESAAQSVQIVNDGNTTALTNVSPGLSLGTSNYALQGGGSDCSSTFSLNPAASCNVSVEFTPGTGVTGAVTDAATLTDNNLNASPSVQEAISLSGTAVNLQITLPTSTTLPGGTVGVAYGPVTFSAGGGTGTGYTWAATGLPAGLSLDSTTGALSGTPTAVASAVTVTVTATDSGSGSSGVDVQKNYTLTVVAGTVTVNWAPPSSITYGANLTTVLTGTATDGAAVPGAFAYTAKLNPSGTANAVNAATVLGVGSYTLTATFTPSDTTDYTTPAPVQSTLTVNAAVLTVTANNIARAYGLANPTFTATIIGFVNGDTQATATTGAPSLTTTATTTSPVGNYTITAAPGTLTSTNYTFAFANGTLTVTQVAPTISWTPPAAIAYGTAVSSAQLDASSTVAGTFVYTPPAGSVLSVGAGQTLSVILNPTDTTDYASATASVTITVSAAIPTITFNIPSHSFGDAPFSLAATSNSPGAFTYSVISGPAIVSGSTLTLTGAGSVTLQASEAAAGNYTASAAQATIIVARQASQTTVTTNSASINPGQSVTLTAIVTPVVTGTPGGSVTFFSGTAQLGSPVTLTNGTAQLVVSNLASGTDSISATYSGDTNFLGSSGSLSGGIGVAPLAFTMSASPASQTGATGTTFAYNITVTPTYGSFPGTVSFAVSGLPTGATALFTPSTVAANAGQTTVGLAIVTASTSSSLQTIPVGRKLAPVVFALLLLPLAGTRRMRREGQRFGRFLCLLLLAAAGVVATTALTGCGTSAYHPPNPQSYTITVTATSGAAQQTTTLSLNLQ